MTANGNGEAASVENVYDVAIETTQQHEADMLAFNERVMREYQREELRLIVQDMWISIFVKHNRSFTY